MKKVSKSVKVKPAGAVKEKELQQVFLTVLYDDKNEDGHTIDICATEEVALSLMVFHMSDKTEKWEKVPHKKGEDIGGEVLHTWRETTQDYYLTIERDWVEEKKWSK